MLLCDFSDSIIIDEKGIRPLLLQDDTTERVASLRRLNICSNDIDFGKLVGRGATSSVYYGRRKDSGVVMALKTISFPDSPTRLKHISSEIKGLYHSDDENCAAESIIGFYGAFHSGNSVTFCLEFMDAGSLDQIIKQQGRLPESALASVAFQLLEALVFLHKKKGLVHRDIKPGNILLNYKGNAKISDFGLCVAEDDIKTVEVGKTARRERFVGTFKYMSPERVRNAPYSCSADVWSLGVVLIEAATGKYPEETPDVPSTRFDRK